MKRSIINVGLDKGKNILGVIIPKSFEEIRLIDVQEAVEDQLEGRKIIGWANVSHLKKYQIKS